MKQQRDMFLKKESIARLKKEESARQHEISRQKYAEKMREKSASIAQTQRQQEAQMQSRNDRMKNQWASAERRLMAQTVRLRTALEQKHEDVEERFRRTE